MVEGNIPYFVNNFFSKKTMSDGDTISFDDLKQYGNCIASIIVPNGSPIPGSGTNAYWYVIQIAFYTGNDYLVQIATSSGDNYEIYMRKYTGYNQTWTSWQKVSVS